MQLINYFIAKKARGLTFNREGSKIPQVKSKLAGQISHLLTLCNIISVTVELLYSIIKKGMDYF